MTSVAIVGGGFWGGAIQRHLQGRADVAVFDPGDSKAGSGAAQGFARLDWLRSPALATVIPEWWGRAHDEASEAALVRLGAEEVTELVSTWSRPEPVQRAGLLTVDTREARASVDFRARVHRLVQYERYVKLELDDDDTMVYDRVVVAAGAWTDRLLKASGYPELGMSTLAGSTVIARAGAAKPERGVVWSHVTSPYRHVSVRPWRGQMVQIGASVAKGLDDQPQYERMTAKARELWPTFEAQVRLQGWRPVGPDGRAVVKQVAPGIIVATGGSRIGLVLAGGIARRVEDLL